MNPNHDPIVPYDWEGHLNPDPCFMCRVFKLDCYHMMSPEYKIRDYRIG